MYNLLFIDGYVAEKGRDDGEDAGEEEDEVMLEQQDDDKLHTFNSRSIKNRKSLSLVCIYIYKKSRLENSPILTGVSLLIISVTRVRHSGTHRCGTNLGVCLRPFRSKSREPCRLIFSGTWASKVRELNILQDHDLTTNYKPTVTVMSLCRCWCQGSHI